MSDLFGNHIVGFPTRWLISLKTTKDHQQSERQYILIMQNIFSPNSAGLKARGSGFHTYFLDPDIKRPPIVLNNTQEEVALS